MHTMSSPQTELDYESFYSRIISLQKIGKDLTELFDEDTLKDSMKINWILKQCVKNNKIELIDFLLSRGVQMCILDEKNQTAIHVAVYNYNFEAINYLFKHYGSSINYTDNKGLTHLHAACAIGNSDIVENFLICGVDVNCSFTHQSRNVGPLHVATTYKQWKIIKLLLKHGAEPNQMCSINGSCLHQVCRGDLREIDDLIGLLMSKHKSNWNVYERLYTFKMTYEDELSITNFLIEHGSMVNIKNHSGNTPMNSIFNIKHFENINKIYPHSVYHLYRLESIILELRIRQKKKIELLLGKGADVRIANNDGNTALHLAIGSMREFRQPPCSKAMDLADNILVEIIRKLVESGANVHAKNNEGQSPLQLAVDQISFKAVKVLLDYNADINNIQFNSIHYSEDVLPSLHTTENLINIVDALKAKGFRMSQKNNLNILNFFINNNSKYSYAVSSGKDAYFKIKNLLEFGTDHNIRVGLEKFSRNALYNNKESKIVKLKSQIAIQILKHLTTLTHGNFYASEVIKDFLRFQLTSLNSDLSTKKKIPTRIKQEIADMNRIMLRPGMSFRRILNINPRYCYGCIKSGDYAYVLDSNGFRNQFPNTLTIVEGHFTKTLIRRYIVESARDYLTTLINFDLPHECCDQITDYLNNENLYNLCVAAVN